MRLRMGRLIAVSVVVGGVGIASVAVLAGGGGGRVGHGEVLALLESGALVQDGSARPALQAGKPSCVVNYVKESDTGTRVEFYKYVFASSSGQSVSLYIVVNDDRDELFAAHFLGVSEEKWFFCDREFFMEYLAASWGASGLLPENGAGGESASPSAAPRVVWADAQISTLTSGGTDAILRLAEQLSAIAIVEGDDPDAMLPMDVPGDDLSALWDRVSERYDTSWVRGYMLSDGRAMFVHTLLGLEIRSRAPGLFDSMPGPFGSDAQRWPEWVRQHGDRLGGR